jgi:hypothetical protein
MKRLLFILATVFVAYSAANAQDYKTGLGLRGGYPSGVTVKHFFAQKSAVRVFCRLGGRNWYYRTLSASQSIPDARV